MSTWLVVVVSIAGAIAASALTLGILVRRSARRKNQAGIPTSGRGLMIGSFIGRRLFRKAWLRTRMAVATRARKQELAERAGIRSAEEATQLLGNMKGVFMKVGQIVSFAHDALPEQAKGMLQGLQKDAPPMAFALVRQVIEAELGGDLATRFKSIDETPLAAASIGQVHRARLRDGTEVVVKVQYPGVDGAIESDLVALERMGKVIAPFSPAFDAESVLTELRARIQEELDYRLEARNQALFQRLWEGHPLIRVPRVHAEHTTRRVLTSEYVEGFGYYDFLREANESERRTASATIHDFVFDSMFCHLVYNGDPHPGNYLFHEDGAVTFIDFGCVKRFSVESMENIMTFFRAIIEGDRETHDAYVPVLGLVRPGRQWDHDNMWAHWRYHLEPYWSGEFEFTPEYLARGREVMAPKNTRDMNLPADLLFFTRITFGLNAIAQQLGSRGNFHQSARRHFYPDEDALSALGLVGVELPDRFRRLPHLHPAGALVASVESEGTLPPLIGPLPDPTPDHRG